MRHGFFRVAAVSPALNVADCDYNTDRIIAECHLLDEKGVRLAVFPELSITGSTCGDIFHSATLLNAVDHSLRRITSASEQWDMTIAVGSPVLHNNNLYNCAIVIYKGEILAIIPQNYNDSDRLWRSGYGVCDIVGLAGREATLGVNQMIQIGDVTVGVEIGDDLWAPIPPSTHVSMAGAQIIANLSAASDITGRYQHIKALVAQQSARCISAYIYAGAGYGESTTDAAFDGKAIIAENGTILTEADRWSGNAKVVITDIDIDALNHDRMRNATFSDCAAKESGNTHFYITAADEPISQTGGETLLRHINPLPFVPTDDNGLKEVFEIQVAGLMRRLDATHTKSLVVGVSGGLDSTLALLVATKAFDRLGIDRCNIQGITMPGFGTTSRTCGNARTLMQRLRITSREIPIANAVTQHFNDIAHDINIHDVTYENSQARERTQILMDIANQTGGMVLGTGDLSELALGWATYNGDHMSMYGVNAGVPKTLIQHLVRWLAVHDDDKLLCDTLIDIVDTPISPELTPADESGNIKQKTEDLVGPYELHDFFLFYFARYGYTPHKIFMLAQNAFNGQYDKVTIKHWMTTFFRRFFNQQFKRSCMPDGPKVGSVGLSPRGSWHMPSDASSALWLKECESL